MELEQLRIFSRDILDSSRPAFTMRDDVLAMAQILSNVASFEADPARDIGADETLSDSGWALSPTTAAISTEDYMHTAVFMRGLHQAIQVALSEDPRRPIRVLYAGCGPYALLAVPLMAVFDPKEVQFTLLDIHQESIDSAKAIVGQLGLAKFVKNYEVFNAYRYAIPSDQTPHVIVCEMINAALEKEPQVAITRHFLYQAPKAIFVPKSIRIDVALVNMSKESVQLDSNHEGEMLEPERERIPLGTVFELSSESVKSWSKERGQTLPGGRIRMPGTLEPGYEPMLLTTIQVYGKHVLSDYDSGLTTPRPFPDGAVIKAGHTLKFRYRLGDRPGLTCGENGV